MLLGLGQDASCNARDQPPDKTKRGNVTHCSQKMRATALKGLLNGSGATGSQVCPRPCAAIDATIATTATSAATREARVIATTRAMLATRNTGTAMMCSSKLARDRW